MHNFDISLNWNWQQVNRWLLQQITSTFLPCIPINKSVSSIYLQSFSFNEVCLLKFKYSLNLYIIITLMHGLRTPREEKAFPARPRIQSQSQIFRYNGSIFCLPHRPNFSDTFDLCLHWVSVVRACEIPNLFKNFTVPDFIQNIFRKKDNCWLHSRKKMMIILELELKSVQHMGRQMSHIKALLAPSKSLPLFD